jgi:hypothetical protein
VEKNFEKTLRRVGLFTLFLIAALVTICNIDIIVTPFIAKRFGHLPLGYRVAMVSAISCSVASYVYWFGKLVDKIILKYEEDGQTIAVLESSPYWWDRSKAWCMSQHKKALHPENKWLIRIKRWGYPAAFIVGAVPEVLPGARSTLIGFCAASNWRSGFALYLVADFLKNVGMGAAFGRILHR